ncbi:hypothetical protein GCM10009839_92690 [Catenulispora yoronensis]|uniref:Uncharacterized protein n=1 Tax=Catenulispora yoronensis TaxID=450799 RepID=A0ABN2VMT5_9ACTN
MCPGCRRDARRRSGPDAQRAGPRTLRARMWKSFGTANPGVESHARKLWFAVGSSQAPEALKRSQGTASGGSTIQGTDSKSGPVDD